jgi:glycosyltransferase involved in cell wall biosynthesis
MRVAIVHDWLIAGGAERVVEELHKLYPEAPIYTSYCTSTWRKRLDNKVVTGYLQYLGPIRKFIPFLRILWFSRLDLSEYDLVISSSGAEAKGINVSKHTTHIAYIHAPTHYYWSRYDEYLLSPGFGKFDWLARLGLKLLVRPLRNWDYRVAQKPDVLLANSTHTKKAIKKYYGRNSTVVFPPVDTERFHDIKHYERVGFVVTGRQTPYKRIDLAVQACTKLDAPLTVIGTGPEHHKLRSMAGPTVIFTGFVKDDYEVARLVASAEAFIFAGTDDFGIAPVEALASGTPVIAYKDGGALDYVTDTTGLFFEEQSVDALVHAIRLFDTKHFSPENIQAFAETFSNEQFAVAIQKEVKKALKKT